MIIIAYLFLLCPRRYTGSKSDITTFRLKDTDFSCGSSIFAATATESDLQSANFTTLTFTTQNNDVRGTKTDTRRPETLSCASWRTSSSG